jgi:hypothetical protein
MALTGLRREIAYLPEPSRGPPFHPVAHPPQG